MSTEKVSNQARLDRIEEKRAHELNLKKLQKELKIKENAIQKTTEKKSDSLIQNLLSNNAEQTKFELTKKSVEQLPNHLYEENESLETELHKELKKIFNPTDHYQDESTLSNQYDELMHKENQDFPTKDPMASTKAALKKEGLFNEINKKNEGSSTWDSDEPLLDTEKINKKNKPKVAETQKVQNARPKLHEKDLKEFATLLSRYAISHDPNAKSAIEKQKRHLLQRGLSTTQINHMQSKIGQVVKQHLVYDLKQQLIHFHMSKGFSKQDQIQSRLAFNNQSRQLEGLQNHGSYASDLSQTSENLNHQAKQDLGNFLYEESVNQFTKHSLGQISLKEFTEELVKLQKAAQSAGVEISEKDLTEKIYSAIDHLGLAEFSSPNSDSKNKRHQPEKRITQEEALDDKLRYLYMMKALHPSLRHKIEIQFKMKKCRNGMIKLGFFTDEKEDRLKKQGEFLASKQFSEELHFIFKEEATLPHLSGPEYGVLRKKKAFILKQLKKINHGLSPFDIDRIKNAMYQEMYGLIKEELLQLKEIKEVHQHVSITKKIKHLTSVVDRIRSDVIIHDYDDTINQLVTPIIPSKINEGA